jgi:triacylglycerol lipase
MVRMWISFIAFADPNYGLDAVAEQWPRYTLRAPQNYVFEQNTSSHAEDDLYRAAAIHYVNRLAIARQGRDCAGIIDCGS